MTRFINTCLLTNTSRYPLRRIQPLLLLLIQIAASFADKQAVSTTSSPNTTTQENQRSGRMYRPNYNMDACGDHHSASYVQPHQGGEFVDYWSKPQSPGGNYRKQYYSPVQTSEIQDDYQYTNRYSARNNYPVSEAPAPRSGYGYSRRDGYGTEESKQYHVYAKPYELRVPARYGHDSY